MDNEKKRVRRNGMEELRLKALHNLALNLANNCKLGDANNFRSDYKVFLEIQRIMTCRKHDFYNDDNE